MCLHRHRNFYSRGKQYFYSADVDKNQFLLHPNIRASHIVFFLRVHSAEQTADVAQTKHSYPSTWDGKKSTREPNIPNEV